MKMGLNPGQGLGAAPHPLPSAAKLQPRQVHSQSQSAHLQALGIQALNRCRQQPGAVGQLLRLAGERRDARSRERRSKSRHLLLRRLQLLHHACRHAKGLGFETGNGNHVDNVEKYWRLCYGGFLHLADAPASAFCSAAPCCCVALSSSITPSYTCKDGEYPVGAEGDGPQLCVTCICPSAIHLQHG